MKALLTAISETLRNDSSLDFARDKDVRITASLDYIPKTWKFPAIAVTDGVLDRKPHMGNLHNEILKVQVGVYVDAKQDEDVQVFDYADKVREVVLQINSIPGFKGVTCPKEPGNKVLISGNRLLIRRGLDFVFTLRR